MLVASLRENQIDVRQVNDGGKCSVFVVAEAEARAREIVGEIVEGAPPGDLARGSILKASLARRHFMNKSCGWVSRAFGWAALVAVCLERGAPLFLARQRVHLFDTFTYEFRQPYHTAEKMLLGQARGSSRGCRPRQDASPTARCRELESRTPEQGMNSRECGLLLASGSRFLIWKKFSLHML